MIESINLKLEKCNTPHPETSISGIPFACTPSAELLFAGQYCGWLPGVAGCLVVRRTERRKLRRTHVLKSTNTVGRVCTDAWTASGWLRLAVESCLPHAAATAVMAVAEFEAPKQHSRHPNSWSLSRFAYPSFACRGSNGDCLLGRPAPQNKVRWLWRSVAELLCMAQLFWVAAAAC